MSDQLPDPGPCSVPGFLEEVSPDPHRTVRRQLMLERGFNPASRREFRQPLGESCGTCAHYEDSRCHKAAEPAWLMGAVAYIRVSWPACELWLPAPSPEGGEG